MIINKAITVHGRVLDGRCLTCEPLEAHEMEYLPAEVSIASTKDLHRASQSSVWSSSNKINSGTSATTAATTTTTEPSSRSNGHYLHTAKSPSSSSLHGGGNNHGKNKIGHSLRDIQSRLGKTASERSIDSIDTNHHSQQLQHYHRTRSNSSITTSRSRLFRWGSQNSINSKHNSNVSTKQLREEDNDDERLRHNSDKNQELIAIEILDDDESLSIDTVLDIVMTFPPSMQNIQFKAIHKLAYLTSSDDIHELEQQDRAAMNNLKENMESIINVIDYFPTEESFQLDCCTILRNVSKMTKDMQASMVLYGGINCIINSMETFPDNVDIQRIAIETLGIVGNQNDENQMKILKRGGDKRIVNSMVKHSDSFDIMNLGCMAIISLAADDYSLKTAIVQSDGADQIIFSVVVFSHSTTYIHNCFGAIRTLCSDHDENKVEIVKKGAVDSIVSVMQLYKNDIRIQEDAAFTLFELGSTTETALTIGESGGIDMLIRSLWLHSQQKNVKLQSCKALEVLSYQSQNILLMLEIGTISAIINTMQNATEIIEIQESSCIIIANLAMYNKIAKIKIVEEEAIDSISIAMVLHKNVASLQQKACRALNNLICDENLDAIQAANVPELLNTAAFNFPAECHKEACFMVDTLERMARM